MAWASQLMTSIFGRRLGLQPYTTNVSGAQAGRVPDFIVGPEDIRKETSTSETTAAYLKAYGVSLLSSAQTAASGAVMRLDPPIPGVSKQIVIKSTSTAASTITWLITASTGGAETFVSTWGTSFTVLSSSTPVVINLMGVTTGLWSLSNSSGSFGSAATTTT